MDDRITAPNMAALYKEAAERYGDLPAFARRVGREHWEPCSFRELYETGLCLATSLIDLGVSARDHVGLFADNRMEWIWADCAIQLCGAADVPRGSDITDGELIHIINHSGMKIAFVESEALQNSILRLRDEVPNLASIVLMDPEARPAEEVQTLHSLLERGRELRVGADRRVEKRIDGVKSEDLFTLIYTSGTTGKPKGVMLTHSNMMSQVAVIPVSLTCTDRVLSILPIWHIFERVFEVYTISCGSCTYYSVIRTLGEDLKQVEPTFMGSAPRLWESLHQRIIKTIGAAHPVRRALFHTACFLSRRYMESLAFLRGNRLRTSPTVWWKVAYGSVYHTLRWLLILPWHGFFNAAVLEPIRQSAGGSLKATISGGGALPEEIDTFFNTIGIPVLEGYGMTETSPVIAVRTEKNLVIGTVGPPIANTELRIADPESGEIFYPDPDRPYEGRAIRGEIHVRGPQVMRGYYRDPDRSAETLNDGWLKTGDLGMITFNDCLKILGRCKATIVLSSGENFEPEPIELRLRQSPYIDNCMVVGQDRKYAGALIIPDLDGLRDAGVHLDSLAKASGNSDADKVIRTEIKRMISKSNGFKKYEAIVDFRLLDKPFEVGEELTNLYKLKRHVIQDRHASIIEEIYSS
ncbi:MAG: long-chain fatty acid--CoA ligase [Balneolaceae bacterium]